jgi:nitrogen fixation NifU-like protein
MNSEELYREVILDHARRPRNCGPMEDATVRVEAENPLCGDELTLCLRASGDGTSIEAIRFQAQACAICTASTSLLTQKIKGREIGEAHKFSEGFQKMLARPADESIEDVRGGLGDLGILEGVRKFPMRVKCATMPWRALDQALDQLKQTPSAE